MRKASRWILISAVVAAASTVAAVPALADSPHFVGTPTCTVSLSTGLSCSGKAAGLGNGPTTAFLTAEEVTATYICKNHGGNVAPGQPVPPAQNVTGPSQNITPHNGQITFSPTIPPPTPPSAAADCPNGNWKVVLTSLTYTNVVLHIQQPPGTDVLTDQLGTFSAP